MARAFGFRCSADRLLRGEWTGVARPAEADPRSALDAALAPFSNAGRIGVAVSGGGDSVAALVLCAERVASERLYAATVDHGLRPEARAEAEQVAALCQRLGVAHSILCANPAGFHGNLMEAARRARMKLLAAWAQRQGLEAVILAHTRDDQAETVLMRLLRGAGVDGLSAMAPQTWQVGVLWLRPFLGVPRQALRAELLRRGIGWVEDPTNADSRFLRTRARAALAALEALGIEAQGLAATAERMQRVRRALDCTLANLIARRVRLEHGTLVFDPELFAAPEELLERLFANAIAVLSNCDHPPRRAAMGRAIAAVMAGRVVTLSGVMLQPGAAIRLWREEAAVTDERALVPGPWDGRWIAVPPKAEMAPSAEIRALGRHGLVELSRQARAGLHPHWRSLGLPAKALAGLPAIWSGTRLVAAPLHLWAEGWRLVERPSALEALRFRLFN